MRPLDSRYTIRFPCTAAAHKPAANCTKYTAMEML